MVIIMAIGYMTVLWESPLNLPKQIEIKFLITHIQTPNLLAQGYSEIKHVGEILIITAVGLAHEVNKTEHEMTVVAE